MTQAGIDSDCILATFQICDSEPITYLFDYHHADNKCLVMIILLLVAKQSQILRVWLSNFII